MTDICKVLIVEDDQDIWKMLDCGKPELCKVDAWLTGPGAFCVIQPEPVAACLDPTCGSSGSGSCDFACLGDQGVECTDSHYGASLTSPAGVPPPKATFTCPGCFSSGSSISCQ